MKIGWVGVDWLTKQRGQTMDVTDAQVRTIMQERGKGRAQEQPAVSANLRSRKTVAKYEGLGKLPSELKQSRVTAHGIRVFRRIDSTIQITAVLRLSETVPTAAANRGARYL